MLTACTVSTKAALCRPCDRRGREVIRVEVFGVECSILARDLAWDWIGDAHERFAVGDEVLVRILSVRRESPED